MAQKRDYYETLGVARNASQDAIKKAYRKLAMDNHPDRNPGSAEAEQRFKEAAEAYAILSDAEKRARYDQFGHAGIDAQGGGPSFHSAEDIFAAFGEMFGGRGGFFEQFFGGGGGGRRRGQRGATLRVDLELSLEEVASGCKKILEVKRPETCPQCSGTGARKGTGKKRCQTCGGHGEVLRNHGFLQIRQTCPHCGGQGEFLEDPCGKCKGHGMVPKAAPITITVPPGIADEQVSRIQGQGEPGQDGGPPGDLVVVLHVRPHAIFVRNGDDLLLQTHIGYRQAVLGDEIEVPTITGEAAMLKIPGGTQPGERLRLRGQGMPRGDGYGRGNLVVQVQVDVPKKITAEQEELLRKFDEVDEHKARKKGGKKGIFEKVKDIFS